MSENWRELQTRLEVAVLTAALAMRRFWEPPDFPPAPWVEAFFAATDALTDFYGGDEGDDDE